MLTGADFNVESMVRVDDGSYWIGDEFGPFLLHVDRAGRLLQTPVPMPCVFAPENPLRGTNAANLASSKGFEGMAISPDGRWLYPLLEGTVSGHPAGSLRLLVIERDGDQGDAAVVKRIYLADLRDADRDGAVDKTLVADLLDLANPRHIGGFGDVFRFPFTTITIGSPSACTPTRASGPGPDHPYRNHNTSSTSVDRIALIGVTEA